jgi:hypothetical protein
MTTEKDTKPALDFSSTWKTVLISSLAVILVLWGINHFNPDYETLKISFPNGNLEVEIKNSQLNSEQLLSKIFTTEYSKAGAIDWLRRNQKVFHISDRDIPIEYAKMLPNLTDEAFADRTKRLQNIIQSNSVLADLREKSKQKLPPFQFIGRETKIGVPRVEDQPRPYYMHVRFNSQLAGKRIKIRNPYNEEKYLILKARAAIEESADVEIHLNKDQAVYLFSRVNKKADGIVIELPSGGNVEDYSSYGIDKIAFSELD